jgi:hypothetical protein
MSFEIKLSNNQEIDKIYEDSMSELDSFFELGWKYNRPNVFLVPDRKTIDALNGEKTPDWFVGWAKGTAIYLLSKENLKKESSHKYSDEEYSRFLKHELAHCFTHVISNFSQKPVWLNEGISIYLSGQLKFKNKPEKLNKFLDLNNFKEKGTYSESGFAVEFLVKKYGKEKLLELLKKSTNSKEDFAKLFESIYGFELSYENFEIL